MQIERSLAMAIGHAQKLYAAGGTQHKESQDAIWVETVSRGGCSVSVNGKSANITWDDLREAAEQDVYRGQSVDDTTRELARVYRSIQERARKMVAGNRSLPISWRVHQDNTNVWWVATFRDVTGSGDWIPRAADEGGTFSQCWMAEREAKSRAARLARLGFEVVECTNR